MNKTIQLIAWICVAGSLALTGCGGGGGDTNTATTAPSSAPAILPKMPENMFTPDAGVPIDAVAPAGLQDYKQYASARDYGRRGDPFALLGPEAKFEREQQRERLMGDIGGGTFGTFYEEPEDKSAEEIQMEPQPYRRLVGVLLGDGVSALIQMEDGKVYDVRPGSRIPNSEWTVVSIDSDSAILRRSGNKRPNQILVRLEPSLSGPSSAPQPGSGGGGGNPGGGRENRDGEQPTGAPGAGSMDF